MKNPLRAGLALALLTAASWAGAAGTPAPAAADPGPVALDFHCTYPLIGPRPLTAEISTDLPATAEAGVPTAPVQVTAVATIGDDTTPGLVMVGSKTLAGSAIASAHVTGPSTDLDLELAASLGSTPVPASGAFDTVARATIEPLTFPAAGTYEITVDDLLLSITPRDAAGRTTGLDSFDSDCALDPGQDTVVATVQVTGDGDTTTRQAYALAGTSYLKAAGTTAALRGTVVATYDGAAGGVTAETSFEPTAATLRMYGFFPVVARLVVAPTGPTTGTLRSGVLTTRTDAVVRVPSVTFFGFPVAGGPRCRTGSATSIALRSAAGFLPAGGGELAGRYSLPTLVDCGPSTRALSAAIAGPDNTARVTLTPR